MGVGLRTYAKALDKPPNPNNGAPVLDPTTKKKIEFSELSIIAQIHCNKDCRKFLADTDQAPYLNIVPINDYSYRMPDPYNVDKTRFAKVITFPTQIK